MSYRMTPERFWNRVNKAAGADACWPWMGTCYKQGYGAVSWQGKDHSTHRLAWELTHGHPGKMHVLHRCDNPPCCNPAHLFLGTHADNVRDMIQKGRNVKGKVPVGQDAGTAKLTDEQVLEIRRRYRVGDIGQVKLGKEYRVSQNQINLIVRGKAWKHLPFEPYVRFPDRKRPLRGGPLASGYPVAAS